MKYISLILLILFAPLLQGDYLSVKVEPTTIIENDFYSFGTFYGYCESCSKWTDEEIKGSGLITVYEFQEKLHITVITINNKYIIENDIPIYSGRFWIPISAWHTFVDDNCIEVNIKSGFVVSSNGTRVDLLYEESKSKINICIYDAYIPAIIK
jgi:hypothetical protein